MVLWLVLTHNNPKFDQPARDKNFLDDDLNIYISNIRNGKRKLAKALKTAGPRQIENCRNEGRRIADNGKILHKTINRDFLQVSLEVPKCLRWRSKVLNVN